MNLAAARPKPRWRPAGSTLTIAFGVLAYLGLRQLPPDNSLALVQSAGVLNICLPPALPPYISSTGGGATGREADLVRRIARRLGVDPGWNLQSGWGTSPDPVDWGLRPESCDVLAGGLIVSEETQALMYLVPYQQVRWTLLSHATKPAKLAILNGHWGLPIDEAFDWADRQNLSYDTYASATEALAALKNGSNDALLALDPDNAWLRPQLPGWTQAARADLPTHQLALGVWKTRVTLRRAVEAGVREEGSEIMTGP